MTKCNEKARGREKRDSTIHGIAEVELEAMELADEYEELKTLGEGCFARVVLARHRRTSQTVVLKQIHRELTSAKDFYREYHYNYHLSPHPNVVRSYSECFVANNCYTYAMEHAGCGDLAGWVKAGGLAEEQCKKIARQLTSALDFLHSKDLVHRDVKLENILVYDSAMERIKLCDFGSTRREGSLVPRENCTWMSFLPPEVCCVVKNEKYHCEAANDAWQLGIVLFVCLTGCPPWERADEMLDPRYKAFFRWRTRRCIKMPGNFKRFTVRLLRLFRRLFDGKPENRPPVTETVKYLKDDWIMSKLSNSSSAPAIAVSAAAAARDDSFDGPASNDCKAKSRRSARLVDAKTDRNAAKKRIWEWISNCESYRDSGYDGV